MDKSVSSESGELNNDKRSNKEESSLAKSLSYSGGDNNNIVSRHSVIASH